MSRRRALADSYSLFEQAMLDRLGEMVERLDILIELSIPPMNLEGLKLGEVEKSILELCDLKNTADDMASKLGKTTTHIHKTLSGLRDKNLIKSLKIGEKTFYIRTRR